MRKRENSKKLKTNSKIYITTMFLAFLILIYIFRLFQLQIADAFNYKSKGDSVSRIGRLIEPERGKILDRNNSELAGNKEIESLYILQVTDTESSKKAEDLRFDEGRFNKLSEEEKEKVIKLSSLPIYKNEEIEKIANILNIDQSSIFNFIKNGKEGYIAKSINKTQKSQIEALNLKYLLIIPSNERIYPNKDLLASVLGFVDNNGVANNGLESYYNDLLSGKLGYREFFKAIQGTEIPYTKNKNVETEESKNVVTSIDLELQKILTKQLKDAFYQHKTNISGGIISNPNTGEILAMESLPNFDLNKPRDLSSEMDKIYIENMDDSQKTKYLLSRWKNNNVESTFDPGSVFKIISSVVGMEANPSLKNKIYQDNGYFELAPGVVIKSWRYWNPHGPQNLKEAIKNSSNPVFVQYTRDIGKKDYIKYASMFNFGKKTQIDLPREAVGFFPKDANISDVDFGTLSYGHYVNTTPIQMITAMNSVVNGGKLYRPSLLKKIVNNNGEILYEKKYEHISQTISKKTSDEILEMMKYAADSYNLNKDNNFNVVAKTGTTVKYDTNSYFGKFTKDHPGEIASLFAAYPKENPKISIYVFFDQSTTKNPYHLGMEFVKRIINEIENKNQDKSNILNNNIANTENLIKVPNIVGLTVEEALELLDKSDLKMQSNSNLGRYHIINKQKPEVANYISKDIQIEIEVSNKIKMPNLINQKAEEIKKLLELNKINFEFEGDGKIIMEQSIKANEIIDENEIIKLKLGE